MVGSRESHQVQGNHQNQDRPEHLYNYVHMHLHNIIWQNNKTLRQHGCTHGLTHSTCDGYFAQEQ